MAKAVTMSEIAKELNVSVVTVSKALSGQKGVSEGLRMKILDAAEEKGYKRAVVASGKAEGESLNLGVVMENQFFWKTDSFYGTLYQLLSILAGRKNCFIILECIEQQQEKHGEVPDFLSQKLVDGLFIIGRFSASYLDLLNRVAGVPIVYVDFADPMQEMDCVISDSYYGAYALTNYLQRMGHKKIGYVGTLFSTPSITDRYMGCCRAVMEQGGTIPKEWILDDRDRETGVVNVEKCVLPLSDMPTAFVCNCDLVASQFIRFLEENGFRVPEDISVTGYDNFLESDLTGIGITTYEVDIHEMARRSLKHMRRKILGQNYHRGTSIVEGRLVVKESVKQIS